MATGLRTPVKVMSVDDMADRIEELEAKLANAVQALEEFSHGRHIRLGSPIDACQWVIDRSRTTLAELKGEDLG